MEGGFQRAIDEHLAKYEKQLGNKKLKSVTKHYNEVLKRSETRIRLREKLAKRRTDNIIELSQKEW